MNRLPATNATPLIRTDFSDISCWKAVCAPIAMPSEVDGFLAHVTLVDDPAYEGLSTQQLLALVPEGHEHAILIVADNTALSSHEVPLLAIDLIEEPGREMRVIARELWGVENNLSLANMDFEEFARAVDADGAFRGFKEPDDL